MRKNLSLKKIAFLVGLMSLTVPFYGLQAEEASNKVGAKYYFGLDSYFHEVDTETTANKSKYSASPVSHGFKVYYKGGMDNHKFSGGVKGLFSTSKIKSKKGSEKEKELDEEFKRTEVAVNLAYYGYAPVSDVFGVFFGLSSDVYRHQLGDRGYHSVWIADINNLSPYGGSSSHATAYAGVNLQAGPGQLKFKVAFQYHFLQDTEVSLFENEKKKYLDESKGTELKEAKYEISGGDPVFAKLAYDVKLGEMFKVKPFVYYSYVLLKRSAKLKVTKKDASKEEDHSEVTDHGGQTLAAGLKASYMLNESFGVSLFGYYNVVNSFNYKLKNEGSDEEKFKGSNNGFALGLKAQYAF